MTEVLRHISERLLSCCSLASFNREPVDLFSTNEAHPFTNHWAPSSEFVSSSIQSWQVLTAPSLSEGSGIWLSVWRFLLTHCLYERAAKVLARLRMRRLAWTFAARIGYKYQIRLTRSNCPFNAKHGRLPTTPWGRLFATPELENTLMRSVIIMFVWAGFKLNICNKAWRMDHQ